MDRICFQRTWAELFWSTFLIVCAPSSLGITCLPSPVCPSDHLCSLACLSVGLVTCLLSPVCPSDHLSSLACLSVWKRHFHLLLKVRSIKLSLKRIQVCWRATLISSENLPPQTSGFESYIEVNLHEQRFGIKGVVWKHICIILDQHPRVKGIYFCWMVNHAHLQWDMIAKQKKQCVSIFSRTTEANSTILGIKYPRLKVIQVRSKQRTNSSPRGNLKYTAA